MKKLKIIILELFAIACALSACSQDQIGVPEDFNSSFPWITRGNIEIHGIALSSTRVARIAVYVSKDSQINIPITGSISSLTTILQRELPQVTSTFLEDHLAKFVATCVGQGDLRVLDLKLLQVAEYNEQLAARIKRSSARDQETLQRLRKFCAVPLTKITDHKWEMIFVVSNQDGAIERWRLSGELLPITVETLEVHVVEGPGFLVRPSEVR